MAEQNSISTLLPELLRLFNNSMESFEKINKAITSNEESVTIDIQESDGTINKVTIPSFGFLKNSLDRVNQNFETVSNISGAGSSVRLSDGTFRKLLMSKLPTEAKDLIDINSVNNFNIKSNWFFENLINPLLYVTFNITGQAPINTERAIVKRYILKTDTQSKINFFDNELRGRSDISYDEFLLQVVQKNISYVLDESTLDLPPRTKRYSGKFNVTRISNVEVTEEVNGVTQTVEKKLYKLNKIFYSDIEADFPDTIQLKVGDSLEVISDPIDTRYIVRQVDSSTNSVVLELVEGTRPIGIGADVLKIGSGLNNNLEVEVPVGFDERCVVFLKPIDPDSKIPATNWSPGSAFFTNELTTIDNNGNEESLSQFYQNSAVDFGKFLLSFADDKMPTSKEGLVPNAPTPTADDFSVKIINQQVADSDAVVQLKDLNNQRNSLEKSLKELDSAIAKKKTRIQTTNYKSEVERDADKNELQGLVTERSSQSELYSSVVKEISARGESDSVKSILPKYRVRGFFGMPVEKSSPETGVQEIIKFIIRYRYLSEDGAANPVNEFKYTDGEGESAGAFSNYTQVESVIRKRVKNKITGKFEWAAIDNENADEVNINQVDIPIRKGEIVEFQIKSVSEAGFPSNPLISDWSNPVRVEFPANLSSDSAVDSILEQNKEDLAKVTLQEDLDSKGIIEHLATQFRANEKLYTHTAETIASGFLSEGQTPISLFEMLTQMKAQLTEFSEILKNAAGELKVSILDDSGNEIKILRDTTTKIFAGFYSQEVENLDDPRGAIVSKTFFINISDAEQTPLQLISRIAGSRTRMVKQSENPAFSLSEAQGGSVILPATYPYLNNSAANQSDGVATYKTNDSDYNTLRKYDLTPIVLTAPEVDGDNPHGQIKSISPYQSVQAKNQFIYSRFKDVSSEDSFYSYINPDGDFIINLDTAENFYGRSSFIPYTGNYGDDDFIWGGLFDGETGAISQTSSFSGGNDDTIEVHIEHPYLQATASSNAFNTFKAAYEQLTGDDVTFSSIPFPFTTPAEVFAANLAIGAATKVMFRHSKFASLKSDEDKGKQQSIYLNENVVELDALPGTGNYPNILEAPGNTSQQFQASLTYNNTVLNGLTAVEYDRNVKTSFDIFDQYLLGRKSCGSYLFIASDDHESIQVDGDAVNSTKTIQFGSQNSINIPLVFQYRMTDYFGVGSGVDGGLGNIGGDSTGATTNLVYSKKIGFDIYPNANDVYQFDIEVFAKYRPDNLNIDVFPSATVSKGLQDLEKTVSGLTPSVNG